MVKGDAVKYDCQPNLCPSSVNKITTHFEQLTQGGGNQITGISSADGIAYVRTKNSGVFKKVSGGSQWYSITAFLGCSSNENSFKSVYFDGIAVNPDNPSEIFLAVKSDYSSYIAHSTDAGTTFDKYTIMSMRFGDATVTDRYSCERLAIDPNNTKVVYCGGYSSGYQLLKTVDGGISWTSIDVTGLTPSFTAGTSVFVDNNSKVYLYQKDNKVLYTSTDGGKTWSASTYDSYPCKIKKTRGGKYYLFLTDDYSTVKSIVNVDNSSDIISLPGTIADLYFSPVTDGTMVAVSSGTSSKIYTKVGSNAWNTISYGTADTDYSIDYNGFSWASSLGKTINNCSCISFMNGDDDRVMLGSDNGIFSCDFIWCDGPVFYFDVNNMEMNNNYSVVSLPNGNVYSVTTNNGSMLHTDTKSIPVSSEYLAGDFSADGYSVLVSASHTSVFDASGTRVGYITNPSTADKTASVALVKTSGSYTVVLSPISSGSLYKADYLQTSFTNLSMYGVVKLVSDKSDSRYVYAIKNNDNSVYYSSDYGVSFSQSAPSYTTKVLDIAVDDNGVVFVPGGLLGFYISKDHCGTWTKNTVLESAYRVGSGTGNYVYVSGCIDDEGIYQTTDGGDSWSLTNYNNYPCGGLGPDHPFIAGDRKTAGRFYTSTPGQGVVVGNAETKQFTARKETNTKCSVTYWTGSQSNAWNNDGNWTSGVSESGSTAVINAYDTYTPEITACDAVAKKLKLSNEIPLTINSGSLIIAENLSVSGKSSVNVKPGTGLSVGTTSDIATGSSLTLLCNDAYSQNGSFIPGGEVAGKVSVNRIFASGKWSRFGTPLQSNSCIVDGIWTHAIPAKFNPNFKYYNESENVTTLNNAETTQLTDIKKILALAWVKFSNGVKQPDKPLVPGQGYDFYNVDTKDLNVTLSGTPQIADFTYSLSYTSNESTEYDGWNCISNPFSACIDWTKVNINSTLDNAFCIKDETSGTFYSFVNGVSTGLSKDIAVMQGFFVHANGASPSLTIPASARTLSTTAKFNSKNYGDDKDNFIRLSLADNQTVIYFDDESTSGFDPEFDAYKLGNAKGASVYTLNNNINYSINCSNFKNNAEVKLGYVSDYAQSLELKVLKFNFNQKNVYLVDSYKDTIINLVNSESYIFDSEAGVFKDSLLNLHLTMLPK